MINLINVWLLLFLLWNVWVCPESVCVIPSRVSVLGALTLISPEAEPSPHAVPPPRSRPAELWAQRPDGKPRVGGAELWGGLCSPAAACEQDQSGKTKRNCCRMNLCLQVPKDHQEFLLLNKTLRSRLYLRHEHQNNQTTNEKLHQEGSVRKYLSG